MALSNRSKRRWSLFVLLIWLPFYIFVAISVLALIGDINKWLQIPLYLFLGIAWALPFKSVLTGIGRPVDEDQE